VERRKIKHKTMKIKIITGFLLGSFLASTHLDAEQVCKDPKDGTTCIGKQTAMGLNDCIQIDAEPFNNKECTGAPGKKLCLMSMTTRGGTWKQYQALNEKGKPAEASDDIYNNTCGTKIVKKTRAFQAKCTDAEPGSDCDSTGTGK
jgi:hypothetical protein